MICVAIVPKVQYPHIKANNARSFGKTYYTWFFNFCQPFFFFLCMILYSQFSVVLPLSGPARRHSIMQ